MNDLEKKSIECIKNMPIEETTYQVARNVVLDYITNLDEKNKELKKKITFNEKSRRKMQQSLMEQIDDYKSRCEEASKIIKEIYKDDNWYKNYEYNDLEDALKEIDKILNGRSDE